LVVAQAWLVADVVAGAFVHHQHLAALTRPLTLLLLAVAGRALLVAGGERSAHRAAAATTSSLRRRLCAKLARLGPAGLDGRGTGEVAVLATRGVDALVPYYARYLPQVALAVIVPVTVIGVVAGLDWVSAVIIAVTVPLVPLFMALVGASTRARTARQVRRLSRLAGHFLDVVAGLPTLRLFNRAKAQARTIAEVTDRYRRATMATLKVAFLSALVLELLATVSVALVAVAVGLRLLGGHLSFRTALFVLVLAPEAYLPLRGLAAQHHASAEGVAAAARILDVLDQPEPPRGTRVDVPDPAAVPLVLEDVVVRYPGRGAPALGPVSLTVAPGRTLAVAGPSGTGKSTLLAVLLGLVTPDAGRVTVGDVDLSDLDPEAWRARVTWVPQRPHLFAATLGENIRLARPGADDEAVAAAVADAGLGPVVAALPRGLDTPLAEGGAGLSAGERQRVALARAFLRPAPLLLLDEPTAGLDPATEALVVQAVRRLARGRTAVVVAHRAALLAAADDVVHLAPAPVPA
jgi:thiol reductant ABC exporter CydD subunit